MSPPSPFADLARLPFPAQITAIDDHVARPAAHADADRTPDLLAALAALPDHEPLAHAVRALARAGALASPPVAAALLDALASVPDTGAQRVLRGLDRADLPAAALRPVADAVARCLVALPLARLGALCLMDRWLKNVDRARRDALRDDAVAACVAALDAGPDAVAALDGATLLRVPGARLADLAARAAAAGLAAPWRARRERFAADVLTLLRDAPRSLSQANAEELLSRRVYTDPGHFLVELLQNAEDAGAACFRVAIGADAVTAWHDGAPFDARDVVGVLSIGQTTKSREQIGFFGVGFKSVYEICERPQVYSDLFRFEIADVSIPRPLPARPDGAHPDGGTLLVLPYRAPRDPAHAPEALTARALAVPPETLLTLRNLRRLEVAGPGASRRVTREDDAARHVVSLTVAEGDDGDVVTRRYAVAEGRFGYDGPRRDLSRATTTRALVALALDAAGAPTPLPPDAPTIFSHLPTGERSGLRFVVHGHFDVPVDRERLDLESPWNRWSLARAGELLAAAAASVCEHGDDDAKSALLDVLPLPTELRHPAYLDLVAAARPGLAALPLLPGAAGQRLRPPEARLVTPPALARALGDAPLDPAGRRAAATLDGRRADVARALGAAPFGPRDLEALLVATLAATPAGAPYPAAWLADGVATVLDALGSADEVDAAALGALPLLPDDAGRGFPAAALRRTTPALRALYAGARPFLAAGLDDAPTVAQATLFRRLGLAHHDDAALVADLADPALAGAILDASGALAVHGHLASLGRSLTARVAALPLFPTLSGTRRPVAPAAAGRAWLPPEGPLREAVLGLDPARAVPIVAPTLADPLAAYLRDLGAEPLHLRALLDAVGSGDVTLRGEDLAALHRALAEGADALSSRERAALAEAWIWPDVHGELRPLAGPERARVPADAGVVALAPDAPWLAADLRPLAHVARLVPEGAGAAEVVRGLAGEDDAPLVPLDAVAARREALYAYLAARASDLGEPARAALAGVALWADAAGALHPLGALRGEADDAALLALFDALDPRPAAAPETLALATALGLGGAVARADLPGLVGLVGDGLGDDLDQSAVDAGLAPEALRESVARELRRAARRLRPDQLEPLRAARLFRGTDGVPRPPGRWADPPADAVYRATAALRPALALGARVLVHPDDEALFGPVFDALGVRPADALAFVEALEAEGALADAGAAEAARAGLIRVRAALLAEPPASGLPGRLAALPLWPTRRGARRPAAEVVRGVDVAHVVGAAWAEDVAGDGAGVLADAVERDADALAGLIAFKSPVALVVEQVRALARPGEAVSAQAPLLADRARLAALLRAVRDGAGDEVAEGLPLWVDAEGALVTGPLWALGPVALSAGLPLRAALAEPAWAALANDGERVVVPELPPARLIDALAAAARESGEERGPAALSEASARVAFYRWLLGAAPALEGDAQALGTLGNAPLLPTEAGGFRAPRELLLGDDAGADLPAEIGLAAWRPAAEVPAALRAWLRQAVQLERGRRRQLMSLLEDAHRGAEADGDVARSAAVLRAMAGCWPAETAAEDATAFDWSVKNHKLDRLRVAVERGGEWEQVRRLLAPTAVERGLLAAFLVDPPPATAPAYDEPALVGLLTRIGAARALPAARIEALTTSGEGLRPGLEATLALARYLGGLAMDAPEAVAGLDLERAAWIPDRGGVRRAPADLYWPDDDVLDLLGEDPAALPHAEVALTLPEALIARLPFRRAAEARVADVLRTIRARGATMTALLWLDRAVAGGALSRDRAAEADLRETFAAPRLRDDDGAWRPASGLVVTPAPELVGDLVTGFRDGLRLPALATALGIHERVGPSEVARYLAAVGARLEELGAGGLVAADPAVLARLPRCLGLLARRGRRTVERLPLVARGPDGRATVVMSDAPGLALPRPVELANVARAKGFPLLLVDLAEDDEVAADWLAELGVPDLMPTVRKPTGPGQREALGGVLMEALGAPAPPRPPAPPKGGERRWRDRVRGWFFDDDGDDRAPAPEPSATRRPDDAGRADARDEGTPFRAPDHGRWFEGREAIGSQLDSDGTFSIERAVAPEYGLAFAPSALPFPHRYAPLALGARFDPATQRWLPARDRPTARLVAEGFAPARAGSYEVALTGRLPRGDNAFPTPLYGRLVAVSSAADVGARVVPGRAGRTFVALRGPGEVACRVVLDEAPEHVGGGVIGAPAGAEGALRPLLAPTVPDEELPDEALAECERLRVAALPALEKAVAVREFVRRRYAYDPSYLEDAAAARWLRRVTRGRPNVHIAALHATEGRGGRYLGRGVCYELGAMACEMLRRAGVPAAIASGWVWEGGELTAPDHLWAMALLPSEVGLRWAPIDPATRDGRALRVSRRPPGDWARPEAPRGERAPRGPAWSAQDDAGGRWTAPEEREAPPPSRREESASAAPRAVGGRRQAPKPRRERDRRPPRAPVGELMRVVQHLAELSGEELDGATLFRRCRELLDDPAKASELLRAMGLEVEDDGQP